MFASIRRPAGRDAVGNGFEVLRFLLWRVVGLLAVLLGASVAAWLLDGGLGRALRTSPHAVPHADAMSAVVSSLGSEVTRIWPRQGQGIPAIGPWLLGFVLLGGAAIGVARVLARRRRAYVRLQVLPYRGDRAPAEAVVRMMDALHKRVLKRWWRRLLCGQPSVALEVHHEAGAGASQHAWLAVACPRGSERMIESALRGAYPNCRLSPVDVAPSAHAAVLRLKKSAPFIRRAKSLDRFEHEREPAINHLLTAMAATGAPAFVQLAITPAPASFERLARREHERRDARLLRAQDGRALSRTRTMLADAELRGGLDVQHRPLFFVDLRVVGADRATCERISSELRVGAAENHLVERGTTLRDGALGFYRRRIDRGEGNPFPSLHRNVFASTELAAIWQLPSTDFANVPLERGALPVAPAPPGILRPTDGTGTLRDALGPVSIPVELRRQNTAVPGAVEQGKSSYLIATVGEDLRRERCAVIVLDPKGDAADAALSLVAPERVCTFLDFARPTCGFNPLAVDAPADVIADYVVAALKNLFTDADIRASSDRYLRNAIIAVLAYDRASSLWDAARLLSVGEEGYAYRRAVGARVRAMPEFKEIAAFFTAELSAQLADARSTTTSKLDAPVNKLARLLNSASIKRVLLNESLRVDFGRIIAGGEVLVVKGALGVMGAGNTSVLMQLLVGMLDAALARQQDLLPASERVPVALKVDEAPLVLNRGFAETIALKRSAGLETVACWQADAQWTDREVREQLDALFAHRVYFATASTRDARASASLTMAEFSDTVRPETRHLSALGHPDVRLHLPKHRALVSWVTGEGRQAPFVAQTLPIQVDRNRIAAHAAAQHARGARHLDDLRQPHWAVPEHPPEASAPSPAPPSAPSPSLAPSPAPPSARPRSTEQRPTAGVSSESAVGDAGTTREPHEQPLPALPATAAESYRELVDMDHAQSVRWGRRATVRRALDPDALDLEVLALVASLGHVLASQLHRRFNSGRAITTTQRRLKRLSDAGLVERFQFHRRDGGGVPMCYVATDAGRHALLERGLISQVPEPSLSDAARGRTDPPRWRAAPAQRGLRDARRDVHAAGWALAVAASVGYSRATLRGAAESVMTPAPRTGGAGTGLAPADLRLPQGRAPHDFLHTTASGERVELERFETIRPSAVIELRTEPALDLLVELDDRLPATGEVARKLERYDHFLAGWSLNTRRHGPRERIAVLVVFICRDRGRARRCAEAADAVLRAARAYAGEYPSEWDYTGRECVRFVAERDAHEGLMSAYRIPRLPADVRTTTAGGDPRAGEARALACDLLEDARDGA